MYHAICLALFSRQPVNGRRRKTDGLNSRFDRMMKTASIVHTPGEEREPKRRRRSSSTSGSSSLTSLDTPNTPRGENSDLSAVKNSKVHSTRDMSRIPPYLDRYNLNSPIQQQDNPEEVPEWLSNTVATLQSNHPLRGLVSAHRAHIPTFNGPAINKKPLTSLNSSMGSEEKIFAFHPPAVMEESNAYIERNCDRLEPTDAFQTFTRDNALHLAIPTLNSLDQSNFPYSTAPSSPPMRPGSPVDRVHQSSVIATQHSRDAAPKLHRLASSPVRSSAEYAATNASDYLGFSVTGEPDIPFSKPGPLSTHQTRRRDYISHFVPNSPIPALPEPSSNLTGQNSSPPPFSTPGPFAITGSAGNAHISYGNQDDAVAPWRNKFQKSEDYSDESLEATNLPAYSSLVPCSLDKFISRSPPLHSTAQRTTLPRSRVHFDSPIEDPLDSDPLDISEYGLDLDHEGLGFRWEKYDLGNSTIYPSAPVKTTNEGAPMFEEANQAVAHKQPLQRKPHALSGIEVNFPPNYSDEIVEQGLLSPIPLVREPGLASSITPSAIKQDTYQPVSTTHHEDLAAAMHDVPASTDKVAVGGLAFAPAPGIFVSPLRGSVNNTNISEEATTSQDQGVLQTVAENHNEVKA